MFAKAQPSLPTLTGDWGKDGPALLKAIQTHFLQLEKPGMVGLERAKIDSTPIGVDGAEEGNFTTLNVSGDINATTGDTYLRRNVTAVATGSAANVATFGSHAVFTNEGATARQDFNLPAAAAGLIYSFYCHDTDGVRVIAAAGDTIRIAGSVSAAAGRIDSTTIGSAVTLLAINAAEWVAIASLGTWSVT